MYILDGALSRPGQSSTVAHPAKVQLDTAATGQWPRQCTTEDGTVNVDKAQQAAIAEMHINHCGINRTTEGTARLLKSFDLPVPANLRNRVGAYIGSCIPCAKRRAGLQKPNTEAHSTHYDVAGVRLQMDFLEGMGSPEERRLHKGTAATAVLVIVDTFTRYVKLYAVADKTADVTRQCLIKYFCDIYRPDAIVSDGGPAFKSEALERFLKYFDTSHLITHPHQPTAHGIVERVNQETRKHLTVLLNSYDSYSYDDWASLLPMVEMILNTTEHSSTGYAPCQLMFGTPSVEARKMRALAPAAVPPNADNYIRTLDHNLDAMRKISVEYQDKAAIERYERSIDLHLHPQLKPGTYVLRNAHHQGRMLKLAFPYEGPFRITQASTNDYYELLDLVEDQTFTEHRKALVPVECPDDATAKTFFAKDKKELFIDKILSHSGDPNRISSLKFICTCHGIKSPQPFDSNGLKLLPQFRTYLESHEDLNKKHLLKNTIDNNKRRRPQKSTFTQSGLFEN